MVTAPISPSSPPAERIPRSEWNIACRTSALYATASIIWVTIADRLAGFLSGGNDQLEDRFRLIERWSFVAVTSVLLFAGLRRQLARSAALRRERDADASERHALEARLAKLNAIVPAVIYTFRASPDGRFTFPYTNDQVMDFISVPKESLAQDAAPAMEAMHPDDRERFIAAIALSGETLTPFREEVRICHPQRGVVWIEAHSVPERESDGGTLWYGVFRDITRRKQTEEKLVLSEERMRLAAEASTLGTWDWDIVNDSIHWSPQVWAFFGLEVDSVKLDFALFENALHPSDRARVVASVEGALKSDENYATEFRVNQPNGQTVWIMAVGKVLRDAKGAAIRMVGIHLDTTERARAAAALRKSEELHRTLFNTLAEGVVLQHADSRISAANPAAEKILGLPADQLMGRTSLDRRWRAVREDGSHFPGEEHPAIVALRTGEPQMEIPMGVHRPDGSLVWISINARPVIESGTQEVTSVVVSFADVTARKRAEATADQHRGVLEMVATGAPLNETLDALLRLIEKQRSDMICSLLLVDETGERLRCIAGPRIPAAYSAAIDGVKMGPSVGSCGTAAFRREAVFVDNIATNPLWHDFRELALAHNLRACWSTPILGRDHKPLGTFAVYFQKPGMPNEEHVQLINLATHTAAIAINRHRSETELRASERRYRQLVDTLPVAVYTTDADGYLTLFNDAAEKLWGRAPDLGVDRWFGTHVLMNPNGTPLLPHESPMATALHERRALPGIELATDLPDGKRVHFLAHPSPILAEDGKLIGSMNVLVDITEQRIATRALRLWADAFHHCVHGMAVGNPFTNQILACNPAYAHLVGRNPAEVAGLPLEKMYSSQSWNQVTTALAEADRDGKTRFEGDMERADGTTFTAQIDIVSVRDDSGEPIYRIATAQDISERKVAEMNLKNAYDELRHTQDLVLQQERMSAFGQMASGVAHDINNAICPVTIYSAVLLKTEPDLSARTREYLEIIQRAAKGVGDTVSRLRKFSRSREDPGVLMPVVISEIVDDVVALTRACWRDMAQERGAVIELKTDVEAGLPAIAGLAHELTEALVNLIFNAVDAMPNGGTLTVRAYARPESNSICMEVTDTGLGMNEEARRRCLEPFYTTKGEHGTGLGLSIVNGILQRHSAEMYVESEAGIGTTIRIEFPSRKETLAPTPKMEEPVFASALKILVTDDDPRILSALRILLSTFGHQATCVEGGQEAIDEFQASLNAGAPFDIVITDLGMPHVDGRMVAAAVKAASPTTHVILLTGWGHGLLADAEIPAHVDRIMPKPVSPSDLNEALAVCAGVQPATQ